MAGHSSIPPAPYCGPEELDPLSEQFDPDAFAEHAIPEELQSPIGRCARLLRERLDAFGEMTSAKRRAMGSKLSPDDISAEQAADWIYASEDPDSKGVYEDMFSDEDFGGGEIAIDDDEEDNDTWQTIEFSDKELLALSKDELANLKLKLSATDFEELMLRRDDLEVADLRQKVLRGEVKLDDDDD